MLNKYPLWKNLLVVFVVTIGVLYALPNIYPKDPAIQISEQSNGEVIAQNTLETALAALDQNNISYSRSEILEGLAIIRLLDGDQQLAAKDVIERALDYDQVVALSRVPTTPEWLANLGGKPMNLGLDLAGGVHFLLEVDIDSAVKTRMETNASEIRRELRRERIRYQSAELQNNNIFVSSYESDEERTEANSVIRKEFPNMLRTEDESGGLFYLRAEMPEAAIKEIEDYAIQQNLTTLRKRVDAIGVSEPIVQRQGRNRIVIELAGVQDPTEAKRIIGKTANLEFRMEAKAGALSSSKEQYVTAEYGSVFLEKDIIVTGDSVVNAQSAFDSQTSEPIVTISLDTIGGRRMNDATKNDVGRRMGAVLIEFKTKRTNQKNSKGEDVVVIENEPEEKLINLATVRSALGNTFQISGIGSPQETSELALLLRSGALAAPMTFVEESTISASLGAENISVGLNSMVLGLILVLCFMLISYRVFGFAANIALSLNIVLLVACMSILGATLTLPGIAGIVLTVGMAVDANVLIFSRIREELKSGSSPQQAISAGFDRAMTTILDANITTLIVAFILYGIGSGAVKGFAITLSLGIISSMFTAIIGTRAIVNVIYGGRKIKKIWI
ncbi:protein translocase subunit SecD [Aurantivibrio infirmus]